MTPEQWRAVDQLLKAALEREHAERAAFLAEKCAGDDELLKAAQKLHAAQDKMVSFLEMPPISRIERFAPNRQALGTEVATDAGFADTGLSTDGTPLLARGATLGRYIVLDMIGAGGMGVVYAAYDPKLDRKLAIKLIRLEAHLEREGANTKERLLREAQALAQLSHPNVVSVHDVGTWGDQVFLAMEHAEGCSLRQWLRTEQRHWREILKVFLMAGRGISAAHAAGIVHRDFKSISGWPRVANAFYPRRILLVSKARCGQKVGLSHFTREIRSY